MTQFFECKHVEKTIKPGTCVWCGEPIEIGQQAIRRSYIMDGKFTADRMHPECYEACSSYPWSDAGDDEFSPGEFKRGSIDER